MPQRFLRPGLRTSKRFNSVSRVSQHLWVNLLTLVDDFGRYDGRDYVLHGDCFATWNALNPNDKVSVEQVAASCRELQQHELADFYKVGDKEVVQLVQWQERPRAGCKEKWPKKGDLPQVAANCGVLPPPSSSSYTSSSPAPSPSSTSTPSVPVRMDEHACAVVGGNGSDGHPSFEEVEAFLIPRYQKAGSKSLLWAKNWYGTMLEQGWKDSKGNPIKHWDKNAVAYMDTCWRNDNNAKRH